MLDEPGAVVVQADVAAVDRGRSVLGVEKQLGFDALELRRLVRLEHVALERPREQVVVDAEEHVALRIARR